MTYDPNLPAGLPPDFNDEKELKMKICDRCQGEKEIWSSILRRMKKCNICKGVGKIPMTFEEIDQEQQEKSEPDDL